VNRSPVIGRSERRKHARSELFRRVLHSLC
jgi:hypothetical protein